MIFRFAAILCIMGQLAAPTWAGVCCALFGVCGQPVQQQSGAMARSAPTPPETGAPAATARATACDRALRVASCCAAPAPSCASPDVTCAAPGPAPSRCALTAPPARRPAGCCAEPPAVAARCAAQSVDNRRPPADPAHAPAAVRLQPNQPAPRGAQNCECCPLSEGRPCTPPPATPPNPSVKLLELALAAGVWQSAALSPAAEIPTIPEAFGEVVPYHSHNQRQAILALWLE